MINFEQLLTDYPSYRPLPGRCIIRFDTLPSLTPSGLLHIPDSARQLNPDRPDSRDMAWSGTVLKVSPRKTNPATGREYNPPFVEEFQEGDRVWVMLRAEDLGKRVVSTHNTRVYAMLDFLVPGS